MNPKVDSQKFLLKITIHIFLKLKMRMFLLNASATNIFISGETEKIS